MRDTSGRLIMMLGVAAAGVATHHVLERVWEENTSRPAPRNPAAADTTWPEALAWGATAGLLVGLARTVARRGLSSIDRVEK